MIHFVGAYPGAVRGTVVVHATGYLHLIESGLLDTPNENTRRLSAASPTRGNVYVVAVGLSDNDYGLRVKRRGRSGCVSSANLPANLVRGSDVHNFQLPPGESFLTFHAGTDTSCSRAAVGGPFRIAVSAGARKYLLLHGRPTAMRGIVAAIAAN